MAREFDTQWEQDAYEKAYKAMETILESTNAMGSGKAVTAGLVDAFIREHRTLQQSGVRALVGMLTAWVSEAYGTEDQLVDARNRSSWEFAQELRKMGPLFPNI